MHIAFLCNEIRGGWKPTDKRLGGSEESIVEWAKELERRGHRVTIYDNDNRDSYVGGEDVCINVKSSDKPPIGPTAYLTNETDATSKDLSAYDGVIWPSEWALENIPVNNPVKFILSHGYDDAKINTSQPKINKQCLYASSPDRGLETLLRAWPKVYAEHPDATLIVTYGAQEYNIPGVTFVDATEEEMNHLYNTSDIWCHPCSGGELFGITGIKAQAAGCVPVIIPTMALKETVRHGFFATKETYADVLCMALRDDNGKKDHYRKLLAKEKYDNWKASTDRLEEIIQTVLQS
jgi:glycosyltransferase involved in cell wall biosynthesis